ncbi:phospho-sugar mutase [Clostridium fungisolvens]|uniref:Phosphoglucomutase n=1 Tax=Clostridium fungisolvens TaxID=1604897 RepID=A0A6V8SNI9_9CLOT|nr:phospho-sugar mutase [Clostridium fungisolvens]GFP76758.1 Phosphoglucomutase [Clostridium fungisolvens]
MTYSEKYEQWIQSPTINEDIKNELRRITDEKEIEDRFYKELDFGTGGLRGVIGAGTNRMNIYTVGKATQGLADYINEAYTEGKSAAIAYDSRNMSREFAKAAALTLCANNIKVYLFEDLRPTPMLSYTVRKLNCKSGIVITASHNPKQYNGYKVYGDDGGQVTDEPAKKIIGYVNAISDYADIKTLSEEEALEKGLLEYIGEDIDKTYIDAVKALTIRKELVNSNAKDLKIIYTPIHGSGNIPVRRVLNELGYENLHVVKEQEKPDGNFPTASYPNPEEPAVFKLALELAKEVQPDIIFGTDPDCDRIGVVVKDNEGEYKVLTGNQTGMLLTHYVLDALKDTNSLPSNGAVIKTIVTTEAVRKMAAHYNVTLIDVLTGFKYIGEKIREFEETGSHKYLFGFEESYGYLAGEFVRDKDAVIASMLIAEMTLYYKSKGKTLYDGLIEIYNEYGFYKENLVSLELKGKEGQEKIASCIDNMRNNPVSNVNGVKIVKRFDYKKSEEVDVVSNSVNSIDLPKSNVLKYILEDDSWFVVRPSGTEPKMKVYLSIVGSSLVDAENKIKKYTEEVMKIINEKLS